GRSWDGAGSASPWWSSGARPAQHTGCGADRAARPLAVAHAGPGGPAGVRGQVEVLAQREARVVGRHVDAAKVAVALERDPEHVVGLALHPLGARTQVGRARGAREG